MKTLFAISFFLFSLALLPAQERKPIAPGLPPSRLDTGDLDAVRKARSLRVLVSYSMTNFFVEAGQQRGFECEMFNEYEKFLNQGVKKDRMTKLFFVPLPFKDLIPALNRGVGDIVAANLTVTGERKKEVAFTDPYLSGICEVVVAHRGVEGLNRLEDLAGRTVIVKEASSYDQHLQQLNRSFADRGLAPVEIVHPGEVMDTEDVLELVNAGAFDLTVCDHHIAELWASVFPDYTVRTDLTLRESRDIAWAVRQGNPQLLAHLNAFIKENRKGTLIGNILFKRYYQNEKWIVNPLSDAEMEKLVKLEGLFYKYAQKYGFDWLLISAQAYQESQLDPNTVSSAGAVGLMQLLPSTAKDMGFTDLRNPEENIHAGVKYMAYLRENFFNDPAIADDERLYLMLAAYNAGPGRVSGWRKKAAARGRDPNRWFHHVERVALEEGIRQPVVYVGNIVKYFAAYKLLYRIKVEKAAERKALQGG